MALVDLHLLNTIPLLLSVPRQHIYSQSGPRVSGSYFLERDYRPLLLGGTRPPGLNSSATRPTRCRKQVNRHTRHLPLGYRPIFFSLDLLPAIDDHIFPPKTPSTALPPHPSVHPNLSSEYTLLHADKCTLRQVCGWVNVDIFSTSSPPTFPDSYLSPLIPLWWQQTFSIWRTTSDGVWWQLWEASGGSVWLCDEKSAVIQEPSVILLLKEHGLHHPGFNHFLLTLTMRNDNTWQRLSFSFCIFLKLSWSYTMCLWH